MRLDAAITAWARRYRMALCRFLRHGPPASPPSAERLGGQAVALGLETLAVAGIHAQALNSATLRDGSPGNARQRWIERADTFFKETIVPIEATHCAARKADSCNERLTRTLRRRTGESSASAEQLKRATARRQAAEASAGEREARHEKQLANAQRRQKRLRYRMRNILSQQEGERKHIGGELRDEIAQALLAIDLSLLALNAAGHVHTEKTWKTIANAQHNLQEFATNGFLTGDLAASIVRADESIILRSNV